MTTVAILVLGLVGSASPGADASGSRPVCIGRAVQAADGSPSGVDDCALAKIMERAALRVHLADCARVLRAAPEQVFGGFGFSFRLHPGGGVSHIRTQPSVFDRTGLPACLRRVLQRRLAGERRGKPALVRGHFTLHQDAQRGFSFSLSSSLIEHRAPPPPPLEGSFERDGDGWLSWCPLGSGRLGLRLLPRSVVQYRPAALDPALPGAHALHLVDGCEQELHVDHAEGWTRADWRRARKKACACLEELLKHPELDVRATAAERLARGRYWSGRRALTTAIHSMVGLDEEDHNGEQTVKMPPGVAEGLGVVRMVRAHLRLRRWIKDGVLEALARHPMRVVRMQLLSKVLDRRRQEMDESMRILLGDPDPVVRARACNLGCQREDRDSRRVFFDQLGSSRPAVRAAALIYSRACVRASSRRVRAVLADESEPLVVLLMLEALPDPPVELVAEQGAAELFHPCPARRFIAARLLGRLTERPLEMLRRALGRERDPALRAQLVALLDASDGPPPVRYKVQLWLQR